jgi:hypothetical protein
MGCSLLPDRWLRKWKWGRVLSECSDTHDANYGKGISRKTADRRFRKDLEQRGCPKIAFAAYWAVRIFGRLPWHYPGRKRNSEANDV